MAVEFFIVIESLINDGSKFSLYMSYIFLHQKIYSILRGFKKNVV